MNVFKRNYRRYSGFEPPLEQGTQGNVPLDGNMEPILFEWLWEGGWCIEY